VAPPVSQVFPSPLRYPGGKGKVANFIKLVMIENELVGSEYVEPYAGGASVALSLLFEQYATHIHINDLDRSLAAFWRVVLYRTDELTSMISAATVDMEQRERQRAVQEATDPGDLELAFSTFFLNRTSRSGIIGGGVIGGTEQRGKWKIDARFNKADLIKRIERIARFSSRITVTELDAAEFLRYRLPQVERPFVYLDPPYFVKGEGLYQNFYQHADHAEIEGLVRQIDAPWVVSYDAAPEIGTLYSDVRRLQYGLRYSAQARYLGSEVMYFAPGLNVPEVESPASVPTSAVDAARLAALDY
jgi:DNA adenine methylase